MNGSAFKFVGTNAYWLPALNTDQDISDTLGNMSAAGIKVVRTWAFNDVPTIPTEGTWFQHISPDGTTTINNGPNGLQKLDKVVELAEKHGIYLLLSLTNNWNPILADNSTTPNVTRRDAITGNLLNRNILSNDYGGMDAYVRQFGTNKLHDEFYTNQMIIDLFKNYTTNIVSRYVNSPAIFGWELANDPRCNSSLTSVTCTTQTVTRWHSTLAKHVASVDPNHIIGSGSGGFLCPDCPKLFLKPTPPVPPPGPSAAARRRQPATISKRELIKERAEKRRRTREQKKRQGTLKADGIQIRGRWASTATRRQDSGLGPAFDGSQGVDSQDILAIPQIGFSSFQLFPDQDNYAKDDHDPDLPPFNHTVQTGLDWIQNQAQSAQQVGKPSLLSGFGLVTQNNAQDFVPFNSTISPDTASTSAPDGTTGVTDDQRNDAYGQWLQAGLKGGISGMMQYQWGQSNLTAATGTVVDNNSTDTSSAPPAGNPASPVQTGTNMSPDDGYSTSGVGLDGVQSVLQAASQNIGKDS